MLRKRETKWDREIVLIRKGENNRDRKRERERRVYKERKRRSIYRERVLIEKKWNRGWKSGGERKNDISKTYCKRERANKTVRILQKNEVNNWRTDKK